MVSGKSGNSDLNSQFLENLALSVDLNKTSINKKNFSIDKSTSYYISKKIFGQTEEIFEFDENSETYFDFKFGYSTEILGKAIFSISYDQIVFLMQNKIPLEQMEMKVFINNETIPNIIDNEYIDSNLNGNILF